MAETMLNLEPKPDTRPPSIAHIEKEMQNHRFKLNNRSIYRLASRPNPSTNFPGPVSTSAAPRDDVDNPSDAGKDDDEDDGAPPRSRKKLIDPLLLVLPPWEWECPVGGASLALRIRKASCFPSWEGGGWDDDGAVGVEGVDALPSLATSWFLCSLSDSLLALSSVLIIRTQTIHHPRLVLHVRSTSRGRARVSR